MQICKFCPHPVDPDDPDTYHEVSTWVNGPKKDGAVHREYTGEMAHKECIDQIMSGQVAGQQTLFDA